LILHGDYIDMFDDKLPVLTSPEVGAGEVRLFIDLSKTDRSSPSEILAASGRISNVKTGQRSLCCKIKAPSEMNGCMRIRTKRPPKFVTAKTGSENTATKSIYDKKTGTTYIEFPSSPKGVAIKIIF
ncbi:MAG: hypothetical protein IKX78_03515, partial [Clostridia bacterium]|nr:hypothetical protein [Clostridia bacterium]